MAEAGLFMYRHKNVNTDVPLAVGQEATAEGKKRVRNDIAKGAEVQVVLSQQSYMGNIDSHLNISFPTIEIANLGLTAAAGAVGGPDAAKAFALAATAVV